MKYYCIYRITNLVNGKTYIGQHRYANEQDPLGNYYGSGTIISRAVKKYGKENFKREVLYSRIINKDTINAMERWSIKKYKPEYNIAAGGNADPTYCKRSLDKCWRVWTNYFLGKGYGYTNLYKNFFLRGIKRDTSIGRKISQTKKGKKLSVDHKRKLSLAALKRDNTNVGKSAIGKIWWNNGEAEMQAFDCPEEGFVKGRLYTVYYTDGIHNVRCPLGKEPKGYRRGRTFRYRSL